MTSIKLITSRLTNGFKLYQIVKFPTRGQNLLDLIFTNMKEFYKQPIKRPAFGLSDHDTIEIQPLERLQIQITSEIEGSETNQTSCNEYGFEGS